MDTLAEWMEYHIDKLELTNNSFFSLSAYSVGEYRKSRRMPKFEGYKLLCVTFGLTPSRNQFDTFKKNFIPNGER